MWLHRQLPTSVGPGCFGSGESGCHGTTGSTRRKSTGGNPRLARSQCCPLSVISCQLQKRYFHFTTDDGRWLSSDQGKHLSSPCPLCLCGYYYAPRMAHLPSIQILDKQPDPVYAVALLVFRLDTPWVLSPPGSYLSPPANG